MLSQNRVAGPGRPLGGENGSGAAREAGGPRHELHFLLDKKAPSVY